MSDDTWFAIADAEAENDPSTAGRPALVLDRATRVPAVGKFGWKAQVPTLRQFAGDALVNESGIITELGCNACHLPSIQTAANRIGALDRVTFHPYADFLLHDMGALGDGIVQGRAGGREMRTAPLWGLRFSPRLLHHGSANGIEQAIARHDGQAARSRARYEALDPERLAALLAFLRSL